MILRLFKYLKGYVRIKIIGYSPERFMNLCSNHDLLIWDIENYNDYYIMCISIAGFFQLKPILKKTKTKVVVLERYGLPFFIPKVKKRIIFVIGLLGCLTMLGLMSGHLWSIELIGNTSITNDVFMDFLKEKSIVYGMRKTNIPVEELEKWIREEYPIITWASVKIKGTKLEISIKENQVLELNSIETFSERSDLITEKDGMIVSIITRKGVPQVVSGSEVHAGDVIVSGQIPIYGDDTSIKNYQYCHADADVMLQCDYEYEDELPLFYTKKEYTQEAHKQPFVEVFGMHIPISWGKVKYEAYDSITNKKQVKILDNFYLPIFYGDTTHREYELKELKYTTAEANVILNENIKKFLTNLEEKGVQIIAKDVKIESIKNSIIVKGTVTVIEKTGKSIEIDTAGDSMNAMDTIEGTADGSSSYE